MLNLVSINTKLVANSKKILLKENESLQINPKSKKYCYGYYSTSRRFIGKAVH